MGVTVIPTLAAMASVYRLPTDGGARSERFEAYVELGRAGLPVSGYNPMTSKDALATVEALLAIGAEERIAAAGTRTIESLDADPVELVLTVATPGMWTDRVATSIEHVLVARTVDHVLWWTGDAVDEHAIDEVAVVQTVRAAVAARRGPPASVRDALGREGLAHALADAAPGEADPAVAEALAVLGDEPDLATMAAVLEGDDAATTMGWTPLGIAPGAGRRHAVALARAELATSTPAALFNRLTST